MAEFEDITDGEPPQIDPYEVLGLERTATADQVKSAYRKAALKNHPDKVPESEKAAAHTAFQSIALAYAVLSDGSRRARYDATGSVADTVSDGDDGFSWADFYRAQYADAVSAEAIARFAAEYKGGDEERADVLAAYEEFGGDMDAVYEHVMLSDVLEDDDRFRKIIDRALRKGEVEAFDKYVKESKKDRANRAKAARAERGEAEEYAKELGVHDQLFGKGESGGGGGKAKGKKAKKAEDPEAGLAALIRRNQEGRSSFLDSMAAKYGAATEGGGSKKGGKKRSIEDDEPGEEAFQAAAARLKKNKAEEPAKRGKPAAKATGAKKGRR